jgi:protein ImuA
MLASSLRKIAAPSDAILEHLREKINHLEGMQRRFARAVSVCETVDRSLPCRGLPLGCVHEIKGSSLANAIVFASLLSARIPQTGTIFYVAPDRSFCPLGLLPYNVRPEQWIHVTARCSKDLAWTVLEAIRCPQVSVVLAVIKTVDLTFSRRLQLAAESSGATGFLLGDMAPSAIASAITRWRISPVSGPSGRGFNEAYWALELSYCRSGRPGKWTLACRNGRLDALDSELKGRPAQQAVLSARNVLVG